MLMLRDTFGLMDAEEAVLLAEARILEADFKKKRAIDLGTGEQRKAWSRYVLMARAKDKKIMNLGWHKIKAVRMGAGRSGAKKVVPHYKYIKIGGKGQRAYSLNAFADAEDWERTLIAETESKAARIREQLAALRAMRRNAKRFLELAKEAARKRKKSPATS